MVKSNDTNRQRSSLEEAIRNVNVNNEDEVLNNKVEPNPEVLALRQEKYYILEFEDRYLAYRVARERLELDASCNLCECKSR